MIPDNILLRRDGPIAWVTLNRPLQHNSIDLALAESFRDTIVQLDRDPSCDVVMITGSGRTFSTGGDVAAVAESDDVPGILGRMAEAMHEAMLTLTRSRMIAVAVVNGIAAGAGLGIVLNADIAIASSRAAFLTAYSKVGLTPDCGVSYLLPKVVGLGRAMELSLTSRVLRAGEALDLRLVSQVTEHHELMTRAEQLCDQLRQGAAHALGETKRLLRGDGDGYAQHLREELQTLGRMAAISQTQSLIGAHKLAVA